MRLVAEHIQSANEEEINKVFEDHDPVYNPGEPISWDEIEKVKFN